MRVYDLIGAICNVKFLPSSSLNFWIVVPQVLGMMVELGDDSLWMSSEDADDEDNERYRFQVLEIF